MKYIVSIILVLAVAECAIALPAKKVEQTQLAENAKIDLSSILHLLPTGTSNNILGSLTHLTQGTSLGTIMQLVSLLNTAHQFTQNLQAIPHDIMSALNNTLSLLGATSSNISALINHISTGGSQSRLDLSSILHLLPTGTSNNILGSLTHLTQGTSLGTIMQLVSLLNTAHQFTQNLQAIPHDIMSALNNTLSLLGATSSNISALINHISTGGSQSRLDLSSILHLLPTGTSNNILGSLTHLTQGTSLGTIMQLVSLLNTAHQFTQNLQAIPHDIMSALNNTLSLLGATSSNISALINHISTGGSQSRLDLSSILHLLPTGTSNNILGSLTHLTQGTSLGTIMQLVSLLNTAHQFTQNLQAIPHDIMSALNNTLSLLGATSSNISALINHISTGGSQSRLDLSSILHLLPTGTSNNILGSLTHLTQGTSLGTIMQLVSLLNTAHQFTQNLQAIPHDIMSALNNTLSLLGATNANLGTILNQNNNN